MVTGNLFQFVFLLFVEIQGPLPSLSSERSLAA